MRFIHNQHFTLTPHKNESSPLSYHPNHNEHNTRTNNSHNQASPEAIGFIGGYHQTDEKATHKRSNESNHHIANAAKPLAGNNPISDCTRDQANNEPANDRTRVE